MTTTSSAASTDLSSATVTAATTLGSWLSRLYPAPINVNATERWRAVLGAALGIGLTALLCKWFAGLHGLQPWLVAPLGASAVLVFAAPASPLAQPWSVIAGNTVSALAGITCAWLIPDVWLASAVAVSMAIGAMFITRSLHPPGGAMALLAVLTHSSHFDFAVFPALTNSALLVTAGIIYNTVTGRAYPHRQIIEATAPAKSLYAFSPADLDAVLSRYNQVLDISRDDLASILQGTELEAHRRKLGEIRCMDIMSSNLITVDYSTTLEEAWALMRQHRIKALPVVDRHKRLLGIMTLADFMQHANIDSHGSMRERLQTLIRYTTATHSSKPDVVGQVMTAQVRVVSADKHVIEVVKLFSEGGHHHIPVVGPNSQLVGMITQSDFVRALYKTA